MKGNITDTIFIVAMVFTFIVTCVLCYTILDKFGTQTAGFLNQTPVTAGKQALNILDYAAAGLLIGAALFSAISAYFIRTSPVFFIFGVIVLMVSVYAAALVSNVGYDIFNSSALSTAALTFPISMNIMQYLPYYVAILGIIIIIAMFGKGEDPRYV
jgi:hypothetical protein